MYRHTWVAHLDFNAPRVLFPRHEEGGEEEDKEATETEKEGLWLASIVAMYHKGNRVFFRQVCNAIINSGLHFDVRIWRARYCTYGLFWCEQ